MSTKMATVKTASDLKFYVEQSNPNSKFFSRENMKFLGDTMKNFGVSKVVVLCEDDAGQKIEVEAYQLYRRKPVKMGVIGNPFYFNAKTFREILCCKLKGE